MTVTPRQVTEANQLPEDTPGQLRRYFHRLEIVFATDDANGIQENPAATTEASIFEAYFS